ncbi:MAG TPA: FHA domain-containing protein [Verrucomicrobiota bacterium]|nr:FHA domain-containing protein [Verrucomicrobiota bacterium]HNU51931.1 FHA domain-containing protein [Verrucomicrobiota bacterium]
MIRLAIEAGLPAGSEIEARRFPFRVGRKASMDLPLEAPGVWDLHFQLERDPGRGIRLVAGEGALVLVNGAPVESADLRNGDRIECGAVRLRFWLGGASQGGLAVREALTWLGLAGVTAVEVAICWWLHQ